MLLRTMEAKPCARPTSGSCSESFTRGPILGSHDDVQVQKITNAPPATQLPLPSGLAPPASDAGTKAKGLPRSQVACSENFATFLVQSLTVSSATR